MTAAAADEEASARPVTHAAIHHAVVVVRDLEVSLRFYRDGIGLDLLQDRHVEGDWPGLLDAPSRGLRAVFLGDVGFRTTTPGFWSSTCSTVTSRPARRRRRRGPGSSCCRSSWTSRPR